MHCDLYRGRSVELMRMIYYFMYLRKHILEKLQYLLFREDPLPCMRYLDYVVLAKDQILPYSKILIRVCITYTRLWCIETVYLQLYRFPLRVLFM